MLEMVNVCEYFSGPGDTVHAVDGVSLQVESGELLAIFGPSGSGKTTLLMLAAGLLQPSSGEVKFNGRTLTSCSKQALVDYRLNDLGFIFQSFNLIPGLSAIENVAIPRMLARLTLEDAMKEASSALELVDLGHRLDHLPRQLSGGEQQRVAIARALVGRPPLVLADEPTGNLDTKHGAQVLDLLTSLSREQNSALVLVTHDTRAAKYADRVKEMSDGKLFDHLSDELALQLEGVC